MKDYYGLAKHVFGGLDIENHTAEEYSFGNYFLFDIDEFMYDDFEDRELDANEAEGWKDGKMKEYSILSKNMTVNMLE